MHAPPYPNCPHAGIVQVIVDPQQQPEIAAKAERLRRWAGFQGQMADAWQMQILDACSFAALRCGRGAEPPSCTAHCPIAHGAASTWVHPAARHGGGGCRMATHPVPFALAD